LFSWLVILSSWFLSEMMVEPKMDVSPWIAYALCVVIQAYLLKGRV